MGYESKIIFSLVSDLPINVDGVERKFSKIFTIFDMGKSGGMPNCFNVETEYCFYNDNDKPVIRDNYNDPVMHN